jgi:hypothetical protein
MVTFIECHNHRTETQVSEARELYTYLISAMKLLSIFSDRYERHIASVLSYKMAVRLIYLSVLKS